MSRLLILACSQRKRPDPGLLPALERYDGPAFRVLRRYLRGNPDDPPDVHVLSAEFGLIPSDRSIPDYDRRMTAARAQGLRDATNAAFQFIMASAKYPRLHLSMGKTYLSALDGWRASVDPACQVTIGSQTQGRQLAVLHDWLHGDSTWPRLEPCSRRQGAPVFCGIPIAAPPEDMLEIGRRALTAGIAGADRFQAWYVLIDGRRVAVKWLVSQLTGMPVASFHADEARRLLLRLGLEVQRT